MRVRAVLVLPSLVLAAAPVFALDGYISSRKLDAEKLPALVELIHREMTEADGRFVFVTDDERAAVDAALREMQALLEKKAGVGALDEDDKIALINAQARANAILTRRDGERLICVRRERIGSHRRESVCETYADKMKRQRDGQDQAKLLSQPKTCMISESEFCPPGNGIDVRR